MSVFVCGRGDRPYPSGNETLYREFAEAHLDIESRSEPEWNIRCPLHGESHASMRLNVEKGVFFCHGCGARGTVANLARHLGVPFSHTGDPETQMSILRAKLATLTRRPDEPEPVYWPEQRLGRFTRFTTSYWTDPVPLGRGYTETTIAAFDLGYDPIEAHAIIPIRDVHGRILGVTRRDLTTPKRSYRDPKGFVKADNLFGSWLVRESTSHYAVLMEGPADAMKGWQAGHPSLAQYGSKLTANQIKLLKMLGITVLVLAYDNDPAGLEAAEYSFGWRKALDRHGKVQTFYAPECDVRNFFIVKAVQYPANVKDPGEMEDEALDHMICAAEYIGYTRG